jgi:7-cyano-7-deazaguanine synthase
MQVALNLGLETRFVLHTPLMLLDKAETFALAQELGGAAFLQLVVDDTHSCYLGDRSTRHDWGYGCGTCPACELRAQGWRKFQHRQRA